MDAGGVRQAAVIPGRVLAHKRHRRHARLNQRIAAYAARNPIGSPSRSGWSSRSSRTCLPELDRCADELGLVGISFHTRFQGVSMDSPWVARYVERIGELGMVPVIPR